MIIQREQDAEIVEAGSAAMADYNRAVMLYEHRVITKKELIGITNTISVLLINAVEGIKEIKEGDNND